MSFLSMQNKFHRNIYNINIDYLLLRHGAHSDVLCKKKLFKHHYMHEYATLITFMNDLKDCNGLQ